MQKEKDLFKPTSFKEKVAEHTSDICFVVMLLFVVGMIANARKNGYIPPNNSAKQQVVKQAEKTKQINTVLFKDSVQYIR